MPWCGRCDRFLNPNTVATDGTCPACGRPVEAGGRAEMFTEVDPDAPAADRAYDPGEDDRVRAPWHFWVMIAAVALYLGWRLVQGAFWAAGNWF